MKNNLRKLDRPDYASLFENFKIQYSKVYPSPSDEAIAYANFIINTDKIAERNIEANGTTTYSMNQYGDTNFTIRKVAKGISKENQDKILKQRKNLVNLQNAKAKNAFNDSTRRLESYYAGQNPSQYNWTCNFTGCCDFDYKPIAQLPVSVDHRNNTGEVYWEETCDYPGFAYAYANLFEFLLYENNSFTNYQKFSKQYIIDGSKAYNPDVEDDFCFTGGVGAVQTPATLFEFWEIGAKLEADYPYNFTGICELFHVIDNYNRSTSHAFWMWDFDWGNVTQLLNQLAVRPVVMTADLGDWDITFYTGGIIQDNCGTQVPQSMRHPDHMVLAVGYDLTPNNECIILKPSRGPYMYEDGYIRVGLRPNDLANGIQEGDWGLCSIFYMYDTWSYIALGDNDAYNDY